MYRNSVRCADERDVLPELKSCVKVGRKAYTTVSCAIYANTKTLSLVGDQDFHLCYLYLAVRWPNGHFGVRQSRAATGQAVRGHGHVAVNW